MSNEPILPTKEVDSTRDKILLVRLYSGMVCCGEFLGSNDQEDLIMKDPLIYTPVLGADKKLQIHFDLIMVPGCANGDKVAGAMRFKKSQIMWVDECIMAVSKAYKDTLTQVRAASAGIVLAKPGDLKKLQ